MKIYIKPEISIVVLNAGELLETQLPVVSDFANNVIGSKSINYFDEDDFGFESDGSSWNTGNMWDDED